MRLCPYTNRCRDHPRRCGENYEQLVGGVETLGSPPQVRGKRKNRSRADRRDGIPEAVRGFHSGGVATTLKHFPGHGDALADSHDGAVYVSKPLEQLRREELLPFRAGIASGSDMVMIGHLILTEIDAAQPAPFSYRIVTELLREELGFQGVVITDGLQMKALTDSYTSGEIARRAVSAGVDILLCPSNPQAAVSALEEAVALGEISEERINQSVRRILAMKVNRGVLKLEG